MRPVLFHGPPEGPSNSNAGSPRDGEPPEHPAGSEASVDDFAPRHFTPPSGIGRVSGLRGPTNSIESNGSSTRDAVALRVPRGTHGPILAGSFGGMLRGGQAFVPAMLPGTRQSQSQTAQASAARVPPETSRQAPGLSAAVMLPGARRAHGLRAQDIMAVVQPRAGVQAADPAPALGREWQVALQGPVSAVAPPNAGVSFLFGTPPTPRNQGDHLDRDDWAGSESSFEASASGEAEAISAQDIAALAAPPHHPIELQPANADGAEAAARFYIEQHCPKTTHAFVKKLLEINGRPSPTGEGGDNDNTLTHFHTGHLDALDGRLLAELPALVLADSIPDILKMVEPLELFNEPHNQATFATICAHVIDELNTGRAYLPQLTKEIGNALECHAWGHNPNLQAICLGIMEVCDRRYEDFEGKFRNTMAVRVAMERCDAMHWRAP